MNVLFSFADISGARILGFDIVQGTKGVWRKEDGRGERGGEHGQKEHRGRYREGGRAEKGGTRTRQVLTTSKLLSTTYNESNESAG